MIDQKFQGVESDNLSYFCGYWVLTLFLALYMGCHIWVHPNPSVLFYIFCI